MNVKIAFLFHRSSFDVDRLCEGIDEKGFARGTYITAHIFLQLIRLISIKKTTKAGAYITARGKVIYHFL